MRGALSCGGRDGGEGERWMVLLVCFEGLIFVFSGFIGTKPRKYSCLNKPTALVVMPAIFGKLSLADVEEN